jgi:spermidine/putrescine transport system substrate-binding protein
MKKYARTVFAIVAVLALLAGGASVSTAAQGSGSLRVLDWAGWEAEEFWIDFKHANPDVDVTFEIGATDADILARMMAGSQADVFQIGTGWLQFYVEEGLVEEIDTSRLTNWDKVPERFKELGQFDGKQYFIPHNWGYASVLYRTDLAPEAGESWNALFDEKYSGHISMFDDGVAATDVASYVHGWDAASLTDEQLG